MSQLTSLRGLGMHLMSATCMTRVQMWLDNAWYGHVFAWSFLAKFVLLTEGHLSSMWQCMTFLHMACNETEGLKVSFIIHVDIYQWKKSCIKTSWVSLLLPTSSTKWNENTKLHHQYGCSKLFWMLCNFMWQEIGIKKSFSQASWNATYEILSIGLYLNI